MKKLNLLFGDCLHHLKEMKRSSIDSLVTDPPAGISMMGKDWDSDKGGRDEWIKWYTEIMIEVRRVLKPGAYGLVWALPRTSHWTATACENAGLNIRDIILHLFGTGFPKSVNLGDGFGTALKPASEHWILIQKPILEDTIAKNVINHGTGGLNIDECRIGFDKVESGRFGRSECASAAFGKKLIGTYKDFNTGRFPANVVFSHSPECVLKGEKKVKGSNFSGSEHGRINSVLGKDHRPRPFVGYAKDNGKETVEDWDCHISCAVKMLDEQSGPCKTGRLEPHHKLKASVNRAMSGPNQERNPRQSFGGDSGGASRFFYCSKASTNDRGNRNQHPTVKNTRLMRYLIKLISPPGGIVLDPMMGSGSTGVAATKEGYSFVGIEKDVNYFTIAKRRIEEKGFSREKRAVKKDAQIPSRSNSTNHFRRNKVAKS